MPRPKPQTAPLRNFTGRGRTALSDSLNSGSGLLLKGTTSLLLNGLLPCQGQELPRGLRLLALTI